MPYGLGRMMQTRIRGGGMPGCPRAGLSVGRGILGTAFSIAAGLALNDLSNPDGLLRSTARKLISKSNVSWLKQQQTRLLTKRNDENEN
jgi:hypothetical protein